MNTQDKLVGVLKSVTASLVAAVSILDRANTARCQPAEVVASDQMFRVMLDDYKKSIESAREALALKATNETRAIGEASTGREGEQNCGDCAYNGQSLCDTHGDKSSGFDTLPDDFETGDY